MGIDLLATSKSDYTTNMEVPSEYSRANRKYDIVQHTYADGHILYFIRFYDYQSGHRIQWYYINKNYLCLFCMSDIFYDIERVVKDAIPPRLVDKMRFESPGSKNDLSSGFPCLCFESYKDAKEFIDTMKEFLYKSSLSATSTNSRVIYSD